MASFLIKALMALTGLCLFSAQSFAAMTLVSITGASNTDLSGTKAIAYAGFAGTCAGDGTSTCDSCTGESMAGTTLWPCNKKNAYPSLKLVIRTSFTLTGATASDASLKIGDTEVSGVTFSIEDGGVLNTQVTWGQLCGAVNSATDCQTSFDKTITVSIKNSSTSESLDFRAATRYVAVDSGTIGDEWVYVDCDQTEVTENFGFCHFETFPGDEKIYADNLVVSSKSYPDSPVSGIDYNNVIFFYRTQDSGDTDDVTVSEITNKDSFFSLGVNETAKPPVADNRIDGLENDTRYCMVMANQDLTGIISFFTPIAANSGSPVASSQLCTTPSKVIGLLDDKNCFIATAAFGSSMAPEVQSFREFRNIFLLSNPLGKAFVRFYYKHSPYYANLISESEVAKAVVRGVLWPVLLFARLSVMLGFFPTLLISFLAILSIIELYRRLILGRRFRGEL